MALVLNDLRRPEVMAAIEKKASNDPFLRYQSSPGTADALLRDLAHNVTHSMPFDLELFAQQLEDKAHETAIRASCGKCKKGVGEGRSGGRADFGPVLVEAPDDAAGNEGDGDLCLKPWEHLSDSHFAHIFAGEAGVSAGGREASVERVKRAYVSLLASLVGDFSVGACKVSKSATEEPSLHKAPAYTQAHAHKLKHPTQAHTLTRHKHPSASLVLRRALQLEPTHAAVLSHYASCLESSERFVEVATGESLLERTTVSPNAEPGRHWLSQGPIARALGLHLPLPLGFNHEPPRPVPSIDAASQDGRKRAGEGGGQVADQTDADTTSLMSSPAQYDAGNEMRPGPLYGVASNNFNSATTPFEEICTILIKSAGGAVPSEPMGRRDTIRAAMRRQTKDGNLTAATLCKVREKLRDADLLSENGYVALGLHIDAALHAPFNAGVLANLAGAIQDALLRAHSPFALAPELKAAGEAAAAAAGARALSREPAHVGALLAVGVFFAAIAPQRAVAQTLLSRALDVSPACAPAGVGYAALLQEHYCATFRTAHGAESLSDRLYERVLAQQPEHLQALNNRALLCSKQAEAQCGAAEALLRRALAAQPADLVSLCNLASLLHVSPHSQPGDAERIYQRALALRPGCTPALLGLGCLAYEGHESAAGAEAFWEKALSVDPTYSNVLCNWANMKAEVRGQSEAAQALFEQALVQDPGHVPSLYCYAQLLSQIAQEKGSRELHERAEDMLHRAVEAAPAPEDTGREGGGGHFAGNPFIAPLKQKLQWGGSSGGAGCACGRAGCSGTMEAPADRRARLELMRAKEQLAQRKARKVERAEPRDKRSNLKQLSASADAMAAALLQVVCVFDLPWTRISYVRMCWVICSCVA